MNDIFEDRKAKVETYKKYRGKQEKLFKVDIPEGLFVKCDCCNEYLFREDLSGSHYVCHKCRFHFRVSARERLRMTCDSFTEMFAEMKTLNPLEFPGYENKIRQYQEQTGELDAFVCGEGMIGDVRVAIGVMDSFFMMGSMGCVVGEKVTRLIEHSISERLPLVIFAASGGARMQEGIFSLMQMAKTAAACKRHNEAGLLYIGVLTNPTTGGVAASFASLGDIIIAEKGALIGFAGSRVIKQTIGEELPEDFQTAEFQLKKGFVDMVIDRKDLKKTLERLLKLHTRTGQ
ncbi:MAG TPA: acetyl-CoA carboxylase carboxyltransferase subunit beta [Acholeplasmataceae bacterium]|jgi:acetyl-CoA carboxylase carboxyl transferase subunit beta|nr:acetyl-CoA carboxylase carboxyltransferase subunit beta [Acholeplasmataceae bacterium]